MVVLVGAAEPVGVPPVVGTRVEVLPDGTYRFSVGGAPFRIRGAGGNERLELLAAIGGNSIRTWGIGEGTAALLDECHRLGLRVTLGYWLGHKRHGADYTNEALRVRQRRELAAHVERFRDHPAVLMWCIGNEAEAGGNSTPAYWSHLNDLAELVKSLDPLRPVATVTADIGKDYATMLRKHAPAIDVWGINSYGGAASLPRRLTEQGWTGPWFLAEFGPLGQWEADKTPWDAPVEQSSTGKAAAYARVHRQVVEADPRCLGAYAFLWGQKQEATQTWFGLFTPDGKPTEVVDVLHHAWTGRWPADLGPKFLAFADLPQDYATLRPGERLTVRAVAFDPEGGTLTYRWELRRDAGGGNNFGEAEPRTQDRPDRLTAEGPIATVTADATVGPHRLFVFVEDAGGKVATANLPILFEEAEAAESGGG